jgi:integrase/recombinase XerD
MYQSKIREQFHRYLILQRFAPKTKTSYLCTVESIGKYYGRPPENLSNNQIQDYLIYSIKDKKLAWLTCNVLFCGLKCFYKGFLNREESEFTIPPRPRARQLPNFLSQAEIGKLLEKNNKP